MGHQVLARSLATHWTTQISDNHKQSSMLLVELGPTTPVFERPKTVYALDRTATVVISSQYIPLKIQR
jgi:hypothetical protein